MSWYHTFFRKDDVYVLYKKNNAKLPKNIYDKKSTYKEHAKKFHVIHYVFKYKFFIPIIMIGNKILGKYLVKKVDNDSHNRNLLIFDKAFEEAIKKWYCYYLRNTGTPQLRKSKAFQIRMSKEKNVMIRSLKEYVLTIFMYDTAYREFFNILMHEIANKMVKEYTKPEYKNKKTGHLFFTTDVYDQQYYILEKAIRYNTELSVQEVNKLFEDYFLYHPKRRRVKTSTGTVNVTKTVAEAENERQKSNTDNV